MSNLESNQCGADRIQQPAPEQNTQKPMVDMADPYLMNQVFKPQDSSAPSPWSQSGELMFNDPFKQIESAWNNNDYKNGTWNISETISKDQFSFNMSFKPDTTGGDVPVSQPSAAATGDSGTGSTASTGTAAGSDTGSNSSSPLNPANDAALQNLSNTGDSQLQQTLINAFSDVNNGKLSADAYQQFENAAIPLTNTNGQYPNDTVLSEAALAQVAPQLSASDVADLQTLINSSDASSSGTGSGATGCSDGSSSGAGSGATGGSDGSSLGSGSGSDSGATGGSDGSGSGSGSDSGATGGSDGSGSGTGATGGSDGSGSGSGSGATGGSDGSSSGSGSDSGATGGSDGSGSGSGSDSGATGGSDGSGSGSGATGSGSRLAGFSTHFGQYGAGYGDPTATVDKLAQDGVNMIRDDFSANNSAEQAAFTQAVQDGMRPLMIVESVADMQKAINEYKDLKTADGKSVLANMNFEFMNEPNPAKVDPAAYAANATQASQLLKAASPTSEFLIGAQAYGGTVQGADTWIENVMKDMNNTGFDAVSIHPYGDGFNRTPQDTANDIAKFEQQLVDQTGHAVKIDVSENGWTQQEDPNGANASELINLLSKDPYVGMYSAYELNGDGVDGNKWKVAGTPAYSPIVSAENNFINGQS